jgi:hypothetical protein
MLSFLRQLFNSKSDSKWYHTVLPFLIELLLLAMISFIVFLMLS